MRRHKISAFRPRAEFFLNDGEGHEFSARDASLLEGIATTGSLASSARQVGISYKTAWDTLQRLADYLETPAVESAAGGTGGGNSRLSAAGKALLERYRLLESEHRSLVTALERGSASDHLDRHQLVTTLLQTSARNQFHGKVSLIKCGPINGEVEVSLESGNRIYALVTQRSIQRMNIQIDTELWLLVKAQAVFLLGQDAAAVTARNCLKGTVIRVNRGEIETEATLLAGDDEISALITTASADALGLQEGMAMTAAFDAGAVLLISL